MNPAGIVLVIAGTWVIAQIFAGNALQRLNIVKSSESTGLSLIPQLPIPSPNTPLRPWLPGGPLNPVLPSV